jgi:hypothetical protein
MKAEDVVRLIVQATRELAPEEAELVTPESVLEVLDARELALMTAFARACEQHGIERAKVGVRLQDAPEGSAVWFIFDWSALDAEVAEENADG